MTDQTPKPDTEEFRDKLSTVTDEGKRVWIYVKKPKGYFHRLRVVAAIIFLAILFFVPFIKVGGHPFMLLDIVNRKFILFGIAFGPHDFHLFALTIIATIISIFLFTVVYGRVFCGWACPQTVFMEMIFRKIEYFIEGDAPKQRALNKAPWTGEKIFKKTLKHGIFFMMAFIIANALLAWFIGIDALKELASRPISEVPGKFASMMIFTAVTYGMGAYLREQVCTVICPYGRLQGVMLDPDSIVIHYDHVRGEPRGKVKDKEKDNLGDCIACNQCVHVCPTGIDIRNGTQLECVNCTACIDACDEIMEKVNRPKGLIRYASKNEVETGKRKIFTFKSIGYTVVLVFLFSFIAFLLATRSDFELSIVRTAGLLSEQQPGGKISNKYDVKIVNKTFDEVDAKLELQNIEGEIRLLNGSFSLQPQGVAEGQVNVIIPKEKIIRLKTSIEIAVKSGDEVIDVIETSFLGTLDKRKKK